MARKKGVLGVVLTFAVVAAAIWFLRSISSTFEPPRRSGPPALVETAAGSQVWIATSQVETRSYHVGSGSRSIGRMQSERRHHLAIEAHDPVTAGRTWKKSLLTLSDRTQPNRILNPGPIRLLGREGTIVWTWLHDQLLALSPEDASVVADRARIEQANPELKGLFPADLNFYAWYNGLIVTLADARKVRITLPDYKAEPWSVPENERQAFDHAASMSHTYWGGAYRTEDFGVRHSTANKQWIGLLSEPEARDAEKDESGDNYAGSEWIDNEGKLARRSFWQTAETGRTREFREGTHPRIVRLEKFPDSSEYLQGFMLKGPATPGTPQWQWRGASARPAPVEPLRMTDPDGVLVLFRTRLDAEGGLALARVGPDFKELWRTPLPLDNLGNRWSAAGRLILMGDAEAAPPERFRELLISIDPKDGRWSAWDVGAEKPAERPR